MNEVGIFLTKGYGNGNDLYRNEVMSFTEMMPVIDFLGVNFTLKYLKLSVLNLNCLCITEKSPL